MATLEITQVYLDPAQKKRLQAKAKARGSKMSEEIRNAIDAYLEGISTEELQLLDAASRQAQVELKMMQMALRDTNKRVDGIFAKIAKMRGSAAE